MFHTINAKFYAIAVVLIFLFCLGYSILTFFLSDQHKNTMLIQEAVTIEREIRTLHDMFYEIRFWEVAVFDQKHPDAEKKFGAVIEQFRNRMSIMQDFELELSVRKKTDMILDNLTRYEEDFNQIVQYKTEQRLNRTRMDTGYQSLASNVLRSDRSIFLKPLFNLTHFLTSYRIDRRQSEYQALMLVIDYLESMFLQSQLMDDRMKGYVQNFRNLLTKDFELEQKIRLTNERFDVISVKLMKFMTEISGEAQNLLSVKFLETSVSRKKLNKVSFILTTISITILVFILTIIARIIINPIRSLANVMKAVENKNISSRFEYRGNKKDEIVQLGLTFNNMLDTLQENNAQLIGYQDELEKKILELACREKELENNREKLEIAVKDRTADLTVSNTLLKTSLKEKDILLKEIHHRVKNNLQIISSLLKLQAKYTNDEQATIMFKDSQHRITSMALIHEQLYQSKDLSKIDFGDYIKNLANNLLRAFGQESRKVRVDIESNNIYLGIDVAVPCGLIVNEVVSNSLKYAFPEHNGGTVWLITRLINSDTIEMIIGDDGIGIPEGLDCRSTKTFGLQLIIGLVEHQLAGEIEIRRNTGTEFHIRFDYSVGT